MMNIKVILKLHSYFVIKQNKNEQRCKSCGSEGVEGLEEEDKLEILGNLLECWTNGGDGDELGDVEKDGENNDWENMKE